MKIPYEQGNIIYILKENN